MATFRDLLDRTEQRRFVGRTDELELFDAWRRGQGPMTPVLNVVGHAGVGKTALLREFGRRAQADGQTLLEVDAASLRPDADALVTALGGSDLAEVVAAINAERPLVMIDTFEKIMAMARFVREDLLPAFHAGVRVVLAGRRRLLARADPGRPWRELVTEVQLGAWDRDVSMEYLERRGLADDHIADDLLRASGGHPLTLSMAADVAELGVQKLETAPDWRLSVRTVAEQIMEGVSEQALKESIEAASVTRRVDENLLERLLDTPLDEGTFGRLCQLSMMRPRDVGLGLHDDVRNVLANDLRWRAPDRYRELRMRALDNYRRRARTDDLTARRRALEDAFFLMEDSIVQAMVFGDEGSPGEIVLEPVDDDEGLEEALELERIWHYEVLPSLGAQMHGPHYDSIDHMEAFAPLARHPDARLRIARDETGQAVGFSLVLPVATSTAPVLEDHWWFGSTFRSFIRDEGGPGGLPTEPSESEVFHLIQFAFVGDEPTHVNAAIWRDMFGLFAREGAYLITPATEMHVQLLEDLGFEILDDTRFTGFAGDTKAYGMLLDLRERGVTDWVATNVLPLPPAQSGASAEPVGNTETPRLRTGDDRSPGKPDIVVEVLGRFRAECYGREVTPAGMPGRLLKVVAINGGHLHVDEAAELLWPDARASRSRSRLRNVLSRLRAAADDILERDDELLRIADDAVVDAVRFEELAARAIEALRAGNPAGAELGRQALQLFSGPMLPSEPYTDWAAAPRERLQRLLVHLLDQLAETTFDDGGTNEAVRLYERAIEVEPYNEQRYLWLAEVHMAAGRVGAAATTIERAQEMLDDLGLAPSQELLRFLSRLRQPRD